jgi:hypothetical protein
VAIGASKRFVFVKQTLNPVAARWQISEACDRIAEDLGVDLHPLTGSHREGVYAEDLDGIDSSLDLKSRLALSILGDEQKHSAVERLLTDGTVE